ncbi:MAG TPA: hypothetical protein PLD95_04265 [bacterium]|jgi:hypothetical protein|nr:hypothetical protein [bacterium]HOG38650.1 hypothetical protein [bacterium]HQI03509.1 hypothetical protein [bacterium]
MEKFHPKFHWQLEKKTESRKKLLIIFLVLCFIFGIFFIIKKTFFVPEKNIALEFLSPNSSKIIFSTNKADSLFKKLGQNKIVSYIEKYTDGSNFRAGNILSKLSRELVWAENDNNSQILLIKTKSSTFLQSDILGSRKIKEENYNGKKLYSSDFYFESENLFTKKDKIYFARLNEYIFCISNDKDFLYETIDKYNYFEKNKFKNITTIRHFGDKSVLNISISDYDLSKSNSFVKNLSFLNNVLSSNTGNVEIDFSLNYADLFISSNKNFDKNKISETMKYYFIPDLNNNYFYYKNFSNTINYSEKNLLNYVSDFINTNVGIKDEIINTQNLGLMIYKNGNFLIESEDYESISNVFKKLLSVYFPGTRRMSLPDGTVSVEYFADPGNVELKELTDKDFVWYYADTPEKSNYEMLKCNDLFFVSSDKQKIINYCTNRDKLSMFFTRKQENIKEVMYIDVSNKSNFPILGSVKNIFAINFDDENRVLFFRFFY